MTTNDLIQELQRDDQDRKVILRVKPTRGDDPYDLEIDRIVMIPEPTIYLIEK